MDLTIVNLFEAIVDATPQRVALVSGQTRLTYAELDRRANRLAHYLVDSGISSGDFIGILARNRAEWIEATLGSFKARAVPVNLNYRYVAEELQYVVESAGLAGIVYEHRFADLAENSSAGRSELLRLVIEDGSPGAACGYEDALRSGRPEREGLPSTSIEDRYVLFTGGTTGMPKGVVWRQDDLYLGPLGGAARRGGPISSPADAARRIPSADSRQIALIIPPLMHGTGQMGGSRSTSVWRHRGSLHCTEV